MMQQQHRPAASLGLLLMGSVLVQGFQTTHHYQHERPATFLLATSSSAFAELGLCDEALEAIAGQNHWETPTPIQTLAIPRLLGTNDESTVASAVWCQAPTGSGKTAAFVLPLLQRILQEKKSSRAAVSRAVPTITSLIVCPTRELAKQVGSVVREVASYIMPCNIAVITGGDRRDEQMTQLADWVQRGEPIDVVVATPGRLVDVLTYYNQKQNRNVDDGSNGGEYEKGNARQSAADAALERRLLKAMDAHEKINDQGGHKKQQERGPNRRRPISSSSSLSWEKIQALQLDRQDGEGRAQLGDLLENLRYLVLDEADRLLGRAFASDIDAVLDLLKPEHRKHPVVQTWLFSATFPKLMEPRIESVLSQLGHESTIRIACANSDRRLESEDAVSATLQKRLDRVHRHSNDNNNQLLEQIGPASTIDLRTIRLEKRDRTQALKYLLLEHGEEWQAGVLVFVATRYAAEHVSRKLRRAGIRSHDLHGKLDQDARTRRLQELQSGKIQVLVATDLASRGLDVQGLACVLNYDLPRSTADFVHRVGRTGRAGRQGKAITFLTAVTEGHYDLIEERHLPEATPRETLPGFEVDEEKWQIEADAFRRNVPGATPSDRGLAYDRMFGGIKGRRKSKKDRLREEEARGEAATQQ